MSYVDTISHDTVILALLTSQLAHLTSHISPGTHFAKTTIIIKGNAKNLEVMELPSILTAVMVT